MITSIFKKISIFRALPYSIRKRVISYYLHRVTFTRAGNSEIIWTSFFYFTIKQSVLVKESHEGYTINFNYCNKELNVLVRKGDSSDIYVFFQIFIRDEYFPFFSQLKMQRETPRTCLDAGANIGYFAIAMLCWFPECKIFSVEPDQENFNRLLRNVSLNSFSELVIPIHAALWVENKKLFLIKKSVQEWAYAVTEEVTSDGECDALTLNNILNKYSLEAFHTIKIDIEGAEQQLFEDQAFVTSMRTAKVIGLEIHDERVSRSKIQDTLRDLGYRISDQGELTLAVKTN
jgi:FkbM family methyltransferase